MRYAVGDQWRVTEYGAGIMLSVAFGFFTVGRFSGSAILRFARPHVTLGVYGLANVILMALVCMGLGWASVIALVLSFFFMSIMYPTHFALAIRGLGERTKMASSFMVTAIVGGSIMPILMGWLADRHSMGVGFLMPLCCFIFVSFYGLSWRRFFAGDMEPQLRRVA
jgi:FHS family L-fucose permease-like MFS transporter